MFEKIFRQTSCSLEPFFCKRAEQINKEHKQQRRRRLRKRHLKIEFVLLQTLSRLFHLVQYTKCWRICLEFNSKGCIEVQEKKKGVVVLCSRPPLNVKLGTFTSYWATTRAKKCTKNRDARAGLLLCLSKLPHF